MNTKTRWGLLGLMAAAAIGLVRCSLTTGDVDAPPWSAKRGAPHANPRPRVAVGEPPSPTPPAPARTGLVAAAEKPQPDALRTLARWAAAYPHTERPSEVCGAGQATPGSADAKSLMEQAAQARAGVAARLFAQMSQSADPHTQAAGWLGQGRHDQLAQKAQHSRDPLLYAFAQQSCGRAQQSAGASAPQPSSSCAQLSAQRMAELDTLNVVPWLWVAVDAQLRRDEQAVAEAVHRASLARMSRLRELAFVDLALGAIPADWPPRDAALASAQVLQRHAELLLPSYLPAVAFCTVERTRDANVRQTCDRLARVLVEQGDTLVDHGIGSRLGERVGWPAAEVELQDARHAGYRQAALDGDTLADTSGHGSCSRLARNAQLAVAHARFGERAYAQTLLAETGVGDAELLARWRASVSTRAAPAR